jgi:hypothetical protein
MTIPNDTRHLNPPAAGRQAGWLEQGAFGYFDAKGCVSVQADQIVSVSVLL